MSLQKNIEIEIDKNNCHICISHEKNQGYPRCIRNGKRIRILKYIYELKYGKIPKNMLMCHKCDNKFCINPEHIFLGTPKDNSKDMVKKNRQAKGEKNAVSKLKDDDIINILKSKDNIYILGKKYNVTGALISLIKKRKIWKHINTNNIINFNHKKKLNENNVKYILMSKESLGILSKKFNVSKFAISQIKKRKTWKYIMVN